MKVTRLVGVLFILAACNGSDVPLGGADAGDYDGALDQVDSAALSDGAAADAGTAAWSQFTVFDTLMLRDVWGSGPNDVWAVGRFGALVHWTGGPTWQIVIGPEPSANLSSVWGSGPNDVWAVGVLPGQIATVFRWNGGTWTTDTTMADNELTGVAGLPSGKAWMVGHAFNFHSYTPAPTDDWQREQGTNIVYWPEDIWVDAATDSDLWIVGNQGISRWSNQDTTFKDSFNAPNDLLGVWGLDANNVWAVGKAGLIMRWNGATWDTQTSNTTADLHAVWASGPNDAWAVGTGGTIVHYNGSTWQPVSSGTVDDLHAIWGSGATDIWAVGSADSGIILRYAPQ